MGSYYYICEINILIGTILWAFGILILFLFEPILKAKLKERYIEYQVALKGENLKKRKWVHMLNKLGAIFVTVFFIFIITYSYNNLTKIDLFDNNFHINNSKYSKESDTFEYNSFDDIMVSVDKYFTGIYFTKGQEQIFSIDIGKYIEYQKELLTILDEKTDNKYHLLESLVDYKEK